MTPEDQVSTAFHESPKYLIFFPHNGFDNKPQIFGNGISIAFLDNLTKILDCEFDLQIPHNYSYFICVLVSEGFGDLIITGEDPKFLHFLDVKRVPDVPTISRGLWLLNDKSVHSIRRPSRSCGISGLQPFIF